MSILLQATHFFIPGEIQVKELNLNAWSAVGFFFF